MTSKFATIDTALATVNLAFNAELVKVALLDTRCRFGVNEGSSTAPCPFHVVGSRVAAGKRNGTILAAMDII
jgi:hypothetical protein